MTALALELLLEPLRRIASAVIYPLAYALRGKLRNPVRVVWPGFLCEPARGEFEYTLWLFLDDSVFLGQGLEYDNEEGKYPASIWKKQKAWLLAYWWAAIRNSMVNARNLAAFKLGAFKTVIWHFGSGTNFCEKRLYANGTRLYMESTLFGRHTQIGWLKGTSPRFEAKFFQK